MRIYGLDHVQVAVPRGAEEEARAFYTGVLGLTEVPKPAHLAKRGGLWFQDGSLSLHLGVEEDFRPARKAHPALLVEGLAELISLCEDRGHPVVRDEPLEGYERVYVSDPFGNRIELMEQQTGTAGGEVSIPEERVLERMTWPEVRAALDAGRTTVIVACGAVEQHGPHLPLFTDAEHGTRLAEGVAQRLGDALVAPTIRVGCSEHHMAFPGTLSLQSATFEAVCRDYCTSLARHGFRQIYLIPSHGGNFAPLADMRGRLQEAVGPEVRVVAFTDLPAVIEVWKWVVEEESGLGERVLGHADIAESSVMLALHPQLVRSEAAAAGYLGDLTPELLERIFREGFRSVTDNGILGDARGMSEAIGRRCIEELVDALVAYFRREVSREPSGS